MHVSSRIGQKRFPHGRQTDGQGRKEGRGQRAKEEGQRFINQQQFAFSSPSPLSPLPSPLFSIRTPTAMVSDLGTEFGVEVDKSGASRAQVYEGKVELRAIGRNSKAIMLKANESARADFGTDNVVTVVRQAGQKSTLVREMPKPVPIVVFNTGIGLKEGDADPHWQVVCAATIRSSSRNPRW